MTQGDVVRYHMVQEKQVVYVGERHGGCRRGQHVGLRGARYVDEDGVLEANAKEVGARVAGEQPAGDIGHFHEAQVHMVELRGAGERVRGQRR